MEVNGDMIASLMEAGQEQLLQMKEADPTRISPWPASQEFGGILWANSAHGSNSAGCAGS